MMDFHIGFDPGSLETLTRLAGFEALLAPEIVEALAWSGSLLVDTARANTWTAFQNPTGATADSIGFQVLSPTEVAVTAGTPQSRRLEYGFSGMNDALGRFYPNWPAEPYLQPAVDEDKDVIAARMELAVYNALGRIAGR